MLPTSHPSFALRSLQGHPGPGWLGRTPSSACPEPLLMPCTDLLPCRPALRSLQGHPGPGGCGGPRPVPGHGRRLHHRRLQRRGGARRLERLPCCSCRRTMQAVAAARFVVVAATCRRPPRRFVLFWPSSHHRCAALSCRSRSAPARTELSLPNPVSGEQLRSLLRQRQAWALRPGLPLPAGCVTTACCPPPIDCPFNFFCSTVLSRSPPPLPCAPSALNRSVLRLSRVSTAAAMISITWKAEVVDSSVGTCRRGSGAN